VTELYQGIGLERDRDRWDATLFRETYLRGASMAGLGTG
jgi:hypothetical protein